MFWKKKRSICTTCLQKTKWKDSKARDFGERFNLLFVGECNSRNGLGILVSDTKKEKIVEFYEEQIRLSWSKWS